MRRGDQWNRTELIAALKQKNIKLYFYLQEKEVLDKWIQNVLNSNWDTEFNINGDFAWLTSLEGFNFWEDLSQKFTDYDSEI